MRSNQSDSLDADKVAEMMNEFNSTIRALEEKLDASGMENDLLQQRLAEIVNERTGNSPAPPLKFANTSDPSNFDTSAKKFDASANNSDFVNPGDTSEDFYLAAGNRAPPDGAEDFYLTLDSSDSSAAWRDLNPVAAVAAYVNVPAVFERGDLKGRYERKWTVNVETLMALLRKYLRADFDALTTALMPMAVALSLRSFASSSRFPPFCAVGPF